MMDWGGYLPSEKAAEINRDRESTYGNPVPNYELLARLWGAWLGIDLSAEDATMMMILLKMMREKHGGYNPDYPDNLEDISGFSNVLYKVKEAHRGSKPATG